MTTKWELEHDKAVIAAKTKLAEAELSLPEQPQYKIPPLPHRLTDLGDGELMNLFVQFTRYTDFLGGQFALAEISEAEAEAGMEITKAKGQILAWSGAAGEKVTIAQAEAKTSEVYIEAQEIHQQRKAYRKLIGVLYGNAERDASVVSRELTRRIGRSEGTGHVSNTRRTNRWNA